MELTSVLSNPPSSEASGPLTGLNVLDVCQLAVGPLAAAWLGQLGADVIKVEAPQGDPIRRLGPELNGVATYYSAVNANKRSIVLDLKDPADHEVALRLAQDADIFIQNFRPGVIERLGLGYDELSRDNPGLIYMSCSGYGTRGPRRKEGGADNFIRMFTAFDTLNGEEGRPWQRFRNLGHVDHVTSSYILQAILAALIARARSGRGQRVETSMLQATMAYQATSIAEYLATGLDPVPHGNAGRWWFPDQAFLAEDGPIGIIAWSDEQWRALCECVGLSGEPDVVHLDRVQRLAQRERLTALLTRCLRARPVAHWVETLASRAIPCAPFLTLEQLVDHPQVQANGMVRMVEHPWGTVQLSAPPWQFSRDAVMVTRAPLAGEHGEQIRSDIRLAQPRSSAVSADAGVAAEHWRLPLEGIRVLELFSSGLSVPYAGMQLSDLGADVVKIERPEGDPTRGFGPVSPNQPDLTAPFCELNRGKRSVIVDPDSSLDVQAMLDKLGGADVVITDRHAEDQRGIEVTYDARTYPALVFCEISAFGAVGPWAGRPSAELAIQAFSSTWQYLGRTGEQPLRLGVDAAQIAGALAAVQGILAALVARERHGHGQAIQVSEAGMMLALASHLLAAHSNPDLTGGWHLPAPDLPPEYPSMAADGPVEVSFPDEYAYTEFYRALGVKPDELCSDPRFLDKLNLVMHWDEYLELIGPFIKKWSAARVKAFVETFEGMAVIGHSYETLMSDPQVTALALLRRAAETDRPVGLRAPWDFGASSVREDEQAPRLGECDLAELWSEGTSGSPRYRSPAAHG
jgi:crotonobetainyl-CoA:carnitine CoA-transferase CaiB-like acyl-CoA transferase